MQTLLRPRGFSLLAVVLAVAILGVLSTGIPILVATNHETRTAALQQAQAYYSARAALEFSMRQIIVDGDPWPIPTRYLLTNAFVTNRTGGKIYVTTTQGSASNSYSITDPNPPNMAKCLTVNASAAAIIPAQKMLKYVDIQRNSNCGVSLSIVSMTISWSPDQGEKIFQIQISSQGMDYNNPPRGSGSTFVFNSPYIISDWNVLSLQYIKWRDIDTIAPGTTFTIAFNFSDGSSKTVSFTSA